MLVHNRLKHEGDFLFKYRGLLPLFFLWGEIIYLVYTSDLSLLSYTRQIIYFAVGLIGLAIRIFVVGYSPAETSGRNTLEGQKAASLTTNGAYSLVRNPLYLGNFFLWLSIALLTQSLLFILLFICIYWLYYERIIIAEEYFLQSKFKQEYLYWVARVPAFIPTFKHYVAPSLAFSWKKVLKKEKNGLAALIALFFLIDWLKNYSINPTFILTTSPWFIPFVAIVFLYFILKFIKRATHWLEEEGR